MVLNDMPQSLDVTLGIILGVIFGVILGVITVGSMGIVGTSFWYSPGDQDRR